MDRLHLLKLLEEYKVTNDSAPIELFFEAYKNRVLQETSVLRKEERSLSMSSTEEEDPEGQPEGTIRIPTDTTPNTTATFESFGEYERKDCLGRGGMGAVWQVLDQSLNRTIAMKIMHPKFSLNAAEQENFIEEAQINAQLQHPGIVPVYDLGRMEDKRLYFTMREVQGRTLKDVIIEVHAASKDGVWRAAKGGWTLRRILGAFPLFLSLFFLRQPQRFHILFSDLTFLGSCTSRRNSK